MIKKNMLFCFVFLPIIMAGFSAKAETSRGNFFGTLGNDFSSAFDDAKYIFGGIPNAGIKLLTVPAIAAGGTYLASLADDELKTDGNSNSYTLKLLKQAGEIRTAGILTLGTYLTGWLAANEKIRLAGVHLAEAYVLTAMMSLPTKYILGRARPHCDEGNASFRFFEIEDKYQSLPSGHCAIAFTTASVLSAECGNIYASILFYGIAGATAYQRIAGNHHWFSDVVLGSAMGIFSGCTVINASKANSAKKANSFSVTPLLFNDGFGLSFSAIF